VYNHAGFLDRALQALFAQEVAPLEIIVVNDASTDDSAIVAERWRGRLEPATQLRILSNSENIGVNRSLNRALKEARGDYVVCTAADDWLNPRFIAAMAAGTDRFPRARLITSRYVEYFEDENRTLIHEKNSENGLWYVGDEERFFDALSLKSLLHRGYVAMPISASLIHAATLREVGGFDPALKWHADWFASTAISQRCGFAIIPEPLAVFRVAAGTYSNDNVRKLDRQFEVCSAICDKLATPEFADLRSNLRQRPSPFAPFARYMLITLACRPQDWSLFLHTAYWWLTEALKGRRPGRLRSFVQSLGIDNAPR
jgi:glycosyltransferase involved in cell wall biosynthesis